MLLSALWNSMSCAARLQRAGPGDQGGSIPRAEGHAGLAFQRAAEDGLSCPCGATLAVGAPGVHRLVAEDADFRMGQKAGIVSFRNGACFGFLRRDPARPSAPHRGVPRRQRDELRPFCTVPAAFILRRQGVAKDAGRTGDSSAADANLRTGRGALPRNRSGYPAVT